MKLDLSYPDMAFLRELVQKEKMRIWKEDHVPRLKKWVEIEEIPKLIDVVFPDTDHLITNEGCIGRLLKKFQNLEDELYKELQKK